MSHDDIVEGDYLSDMAANRSPHVHEFIDMPKESIPGEEIMGIARTSARPPFPPFTRDTAVQKVRLAEDGWNTRDPAKVALAYTIDSRWRNRSEFINGRSEIIAFLSQVGQRARLQTHQGNVGIHEKPRRRTLRLRVA
jgi:Protein of unknown function (DUF1348)